ncbi:hypothetical protein H5410_041596 [Solanum commersonii]|uniref:Uncharacterized protein n=1 Tax=Solanum commersonii TaxID=4109 RepID=A0A9J5XTJ7_SOLCO|nr:hypothetical protein H5410_041596 [Solanum commersonii]
MASCLYLLLFLEALFYKIMNRKLENNNLSGDVMSLASCLSLNVLNVSYNNLGGNIPTGNNFSRFSPDSFIGNPDLCGYWLTSPCHASHPAERVSISKAAILGIALGGLVILLMILVAACRPQNPAPFMEGSIDKPGTMFSGRLDSVWRRSCLKDSHQS